MSRRKSFLKEPKLPKVKLPKVRMPKVYGPKLPRLTFGSKRRIYGL